MKTHARSEAPRWLPLLILALSGTAAVAGPLPDLSWRRLMEPARGAFNRDQPAAVALAVLTDGQVGGFNVDWTLAHGDASVAHGDTMIVANHRVRETAFELLLPPMPPGAYKLSLRADPDNVVEEKDESNNEIAFTLSIPNGAPVLLRCEGPEGSVWDITRTELSTASGVPYPDEYGTIPDTMRSRDNQIVVNGIGPGSYMGVLFGPTINRSPILVSSGIFNMDDPPVETSVVWPRTTPYLVGRPSLKGSVPVSTGAEAGAPRWKSNTRMTLEGTLRNPTDRSADVQWMLHFAAGDESIESTERDTLLSLGAMVTEKVFLTGRIPIRAGKYFVQAEVRVPWPTGFEDLGMEDRVASHVQPIGWIEVEP